MDTSIILAGGRMINVTYMDGTTAQIKVRQLPIRQLAAYDLLQGDEPKLVEMLCGQDEGWADKLTHESYEEIATLGVELNRPPFQRYIARLSDRLDVAKGTRQVLIDAGHLVPAQPMQRPKEGEMLVMPEVRPAAPTPAAPAAPGTITATPMASPSTKSLEHSAPGDSSHEATEP